MKKYIKPSMEVFTINTPSPLMLSDYNEGGGGQNWSKSRKDYEPDDDEPTTNW